MSLPNPEEQPLMWVPEVAVELNRSEWSVYQSVRRYLETEGREGIPSVRLGTRRVAIPTAELRRWLGVDSG